MEFFRAAERGCFKKFLAIFTVLAVLLALVGLYYVKDVIAANSAANVEAAEGE